ncbi:ATPase family AAA domain-containing protein 2B isoform X1 [Takifugu rubripes]|uniref:ATPase family AAA domain-containing protein 2 n=1 Tax=Takifugu rubripes TaxID=31033 RepID=H2SMJ1_TAKRU|nr:ATPase family AAA domain-containing protein 2B isoform X1 [Takifugu rubripes]|eukprot:XP_011610211.1 PREDICTED: ATPase family AAA domain-containing protein 2B [Takifugu rubripes]
MVNTRNSSRPGSGAFISSRTRSSSKISDEHKEPSSDASTPSSPRLAPPSKRTRREIASEPSSSDTSPSPQAKGQRVSWGIPSYRTRLSSRIMQNGHGHMNLRNEESKAGDHSCMNGHVELKRSCRVRKSQFAQLDQSLLFDQLVNSTAEAVLQEMDNISSIRQNRELERLRMWNGDTEEENMDMYSKVKRRKSLRRNTYSMQAHHKSISKSDQEEEEEEEGTEDSHGEEEEEEEDPEDDEDDEDDEGDEAEEAGEENDRPYNLRQRKTVQRYEAPPIEPVNRKQNNPSVFDTHRSPARRSHIRVKKHAIHSSDTTSSSDEERFERRKSKSMTRARNRCLPMNLTAEDLASGVLRDRGKVGASLADVDPMNLDTSVRFDSVGGLSNHIHALKEMVVFPLLYPEIFERFKIQPPRGCLFYGPPGTGKTLVARALANECSHGDRKVSFFMRKGADCLSKWVGESERQLRLLFDQAYLMRPSIIFFDEIDGLAPVRSSRQDQIHSSIVSTLLALMDGLDSRGEIVVIGATNRLDSIDPALRRPGRFDREFLFNLPDKKARKHIFEIHTRDWNPKLAEPFVEELAEKCVGYCGADVKALCTEAALVALRRRYPQIYSSSVKLKLDITSIVLGPGDFIKAMRTIVPASQRALAPAGRALSPTLRPLLAASFSLVLKALLRVFPHAQFSDRDNMHCGDNQLFEEDLYSDDDNEEVSASIFESQTVASPESQLSSSAAHRPFLHFTSSVLRQPIAYRPRLLLAGPPGSGQTSHLAPALLHHLDKLPVHRLDLPTLYSISAKTPEESCAQVFREARRSVPSVVFMPHVSEWWETVSDTVKSTFLTLLQDVPSFSPVLIVATAESHYSQLPDEVKSMFQRSYGEVVTLCPPGEEDRRSFFSELLLVQAARAPPRHRHTERCREILPVAEDSGSRVLSAEEQRRLAEQEENILRELRLFLRDVTKRLATDKRFNIFSKPVDIEEVSDYLEVIRQPMDLSTAMTKIDTHQYLTAKDFLVDIDLICNNALEYNPDKDPGDKVIRHRACSLKDTAHAIFAAELDPEFDRMCEEIKEARKKRDIQTPVQLTPALTTVAPKKPQTPGEEQIRIKTQGEVLHRQYTTNHIKKKNRRRPSWGRGIIRKKKSYKKGTGEEEEPEAEVEVTGPSDSCLTQDEESSCDTSGPQTNGHLPSTEEESSNEPPDAAEAQTLNADEQLQELASKEESVPKECEDSETPRQLHCLDDDSQAEVKGDNQEKQVYPQSLIELSEAQTKHTDSFLVSQMDCVNGSESMDSMDSQTLKGSSEAVKSTSHSEGSKNTPELDEHNATNKREATQEHLPQDMIETTENIEEGQDKEGCSQDRECKNNRIEERGESAEGVGEPQPALPCPPVVIDHQRLSALLDTVVEKSEGYTVEQLERLYSLLSQCIYQHRREYDKTQLLEEMEERIHHFETFL